MSMQSALQFALDVIKGYESEIRSLYLPVGYTIHCGMEGNSVVKMTDSEVIHSRGEQLTADQAGFCRGQLYARAVEIITNLSKIPYDDGRYYRREGEYRRGDPGHPDNEMGM